MVVINSQRPVFHRQRRGLGHTSDRRPTCHPINTGVVGRGAG